jgi:hypothetical protein
VEDRTELVVGTASLPGHPKRRASDRSLAPSMVAPMASPLEEAVEN